MSEISNGSSPPPDVQRGAPRAGSAPITAAPTTDDQDARPMRATVVDAPVGAVGVDLVARRAVTAEPITFRIRVVEVDGVALRRNEVRRWSSVSLGNLIPVAVAEIGPRHHVVLGHERSTGIAARAAYRRRLGPDTWPAFEQSLPRVVLLDDDGDGSVS